MADVSNVKTIQITGVKQVENGFHIAYTFNGVSGQGATFSSVADLKQRVQDALITDSDMLLLLLYLWYVNDPNLSVANVTGKLLTLNFSIANVLRVTNV